MAAETIRLLLEHGARVKLLFHINYGILKKFIVLRYFYLQRDP